jgi:thiol-disulfide isomerase/thioredoxin
MKIKPLASLAVVLLVLSAQCGVAADKGDAATELKALIGKIQTKLRAGEPTEAALAPELKEFDDLLAEHQGEKTDAVAQILYMKATLYEQVLKDKAKGDAIMAQLKRDFPDSQPVKQLKQEEAAKKVREALKTGSAFPDFSEKDVAGQPLSIGNYKGKVVLVDFWATWCGPCRAELPNVLKTYEAHHKDGFEIIGISLDQDNQKLASFTKEQNMTWPQFFDGKGWQNKLAVKYGVNSIPATYLLDGQGTIIGANLRGEDLETAVTKALAKK